MAARPRSVDDLCDEPDLARAPLVLLTGDEELLVARGVAAVTGAARSDDPNVDVQERAGAGVDAGELLELLSPSLFAVRRVVVVRSAQDVPAAAVTALGPSLADPADGVSVLLAHAGGAKGKALLELARKAGAAEFTCARLTRPEDRQAFVRTEVRRAGGSIAPDAVAALVDAVGSDLRELAAVSGQLVSDCGGRIDVDAVAAYHRGRAEVTGFAVSDRTVVGDAAGALETLRWALSVGVPHVVVADALADGVRTVSRVAAIGRGDAYVLAGRLAMPPWKVKRAQSQARGWSEAGLRAALGVVAQLNADVKGVAADPAFALEHAITAVIRARQLRA